MGMLDRKAVIVHKPRSLFFAAKALMQSVQPGLVVNQPIHAPSSPGDEGKSGDAIFEAELMLIFARVTLIVERRHEPHRVGPFVKATLLESNHRSALSARMDL